MGSRNKQRFKLNFYLLSYIGRVAGRFDWDINVFRILSYILSVFFYLVDADRRYRRFEFCIVGEFSETEEIWLFWHQNGEVNVIYASILTVFDFVWFLFWDSCLLCWFFWVLMTFMNLYHFISGFFDGRLKCPKLVSLFSLVKMLIIPGIHSMVHLVKNINFLKFVSNIFLSMLIETVAAPNTLNQFEGCPCLAFKTFIKLLRHWVEGLCCRSEFLLNGRFYFLP